MLHLNSLSLIQFKNYHHRSFTFDQKIMCITGNNGVGKTNLLDAIYYLCFTRSYFNARESLNVLHGHDGFRVEGHFSKNDNQETVTCTYRRAKKEIAVNGEPCTKFSRHLGQFPAVFIAPDDAALINEGSEQRRRFMDILLSQLDTGYLDHLIAYQKILEQRNSLLKSSPTPHAVPAMLLETFDEQLSIHGRPVFDKRKEFLQSFIEKVQYYYGEITGDLENIDLQYESCLHERDLLTILTANRLRDFQLQRTSEGVHRDDLLFLMNGYPLKQIGSQGQRKSFLFALKLAQYDLLKSFKGYPPVLLLDDIFEKLDHNRITRLVRLISQPEFGQVFITDTEAARLKKAFGQSHALLQLIDL